MDKTLKTKAFKGLNNTSDPLELGHTWLTKCENVDIGDEGNASTREGYERLENGTFSSIYSTPDHGRMFVVKDQALMERFADESYRLVLDDVADRRMFWAELNGEVYFNNGVDAGIIEASGTVKPLIIPTPQAANLSAGSGGLFSGQYRVCCSFVDEDEREGGAGEISEIVVANNSSLVISGIPSLAGFRTIVYIAPADSDVFYKAFDTVNAVEVWSLGPEFLGRELRTFGMLPLPYECEYITFWKGSLYAMQYDPYQDITIVWKSKPFGFHLFDLLGDSMTFKGSPKYMNANSKGMVFGAGDRIYGYDGEAITELAKFGIVPGQDPVADDEETMIFWTVRGLYSCFPFARMTAHVSVAPGVRASGCLIEKKGGKRYVACLKVGGEAFNPWTN